MGDARFEQKVPSHQIVAASKLKKIAFKKYFTICFASIGKQEFTIISEIIRDLHEKYKDIFFILVPRHPNDFDKYKILFEDSSIKVKPRSEMTEIKSDFKICNEEKIKQINNFSLLWGDSLGELNFYMAMSDLVFMGDSLNNEGSHNIIEPFALEKPVLVGPSIWGIEYPALEALDVGILKKISGHKELASALISAYHDKKSNNFDENQAKNIKNFYKSNQGASDLFMDQMFKNKFLELNNN